MFFSENIFRYCGNVTRTGHNPISSLRKANCLSFLDLNLNLFSNILYLDRYRYVSNIYIYICK